ADRPFPTGAARHATDTGTPAATVRPAVLRGDLGQRMPPIQVAPWPPTERVRFQVANHGQGSPLVEGGCYAASGRDCLGPAGGWHCGQSGLRRDVARSPWRGHSRQVAPCFVVI